MGRRSTRQVLGHDRDEVTGGAATAVVDRPAGRNVRDHLLQLQRDYGNTAVTTAVQRDRAASTDAPGYKAPKKGPAAKKKGPSDEEKYVPKPDSTLSSNSVGDLVQWGNDAVEHAESAKGTAKDIKNQHDTWYEKAVRYYGQAWLKMPSKPGRQVAMYIYKAYKAWGDASAAAFWLKVGSGEIDPKAPKQEDMSDKSF
jgi:hypothetical protein